MIQKKKCDFACTWDGTESAIYSPPCEKIATKVVGSSGQNFCPGMWRGNCQAPSKTCHENWACSPARSIISSLEKGREDRSQIGTGSVAVVDLVVPLRTWKYPNTDLRAESHRRHHKRHFRVEIRIISTYKRFCFVDLFWWILRCCNCNSWVAAYN